MKKIVAFSLLLAGAQQASASEVQPENEFGGLSGVMLGAAAAGPIGLVAGGIAGLLGNAVQDVAGLRDDDQQRALRERIVEGSAQDGRVATIVPASQSAATN